MGELQGFIVHPFMVHCLSEVHMSQTIACEGTVPVQVPYRYEDVSALANGVAFGVTPQWGGQHVIIQSSPDQDRGLGVHPQRLS